MQPEDDYAQRRLLQLHHHTAQLPANSGASHGGAQQPQSASPAPSQVAATVVVAPSQTDRYLQAAQSAGTSLGGGDRYHHHHQKQPSAAVCTPNGGSNTDSNVPSSAAATSSRYVAAPPSTSSSNADHRYLAQSADRYHHPKQQSTTVNTTNGNNADNNAASSASTASRYGAATPHTDRFYLPPDRYTTIPCPERFATSQTQSYHKNQTAPMYQEICHQSQPNQTFQETVNSGGSQNISGKYQSSSQTTSTYQDHKTSYHQEIVSRNNAGTPFQTNQTNSSFQEQQNMFHQNTSSKTKHDSLTGKYPMQEITPDYHHQDHTNCFESDSNDRYVLPTYIPPPSPAPCDARFIPPPPLSPTNSEQYIRNNSPSPDCFPNNSFPSPSPNSEQLPPMAFIPPPPLSPSPTECFPQNSPKKNVYRNASPNRFVTSDRFASERYASASPKPNASYLASSTPIASNFTDRYGVSKEFQERYVATTQTPNGNGYASERYQQHPNSDRFHDRYPDRYNGSQTLERFHSTAANSNSNRYAEVQSTNADRYIASNDRYATLPNPNPDRYSTLPSNSTRHQDRYDRYSSRPSSNTTERYIPPNAHTPVERYVPQPNTDNYIYGHYQERYLTSGGVAMPPSTERYGVATNLNGDPYMRRDLGYHHHYRLQAPPQYHQYHPSHFHRMRYTYTPPNTHRRCCGTPSPNHFNGGAEVFANGSPSSSSSSSVTSCARETFVSASPSVRAKSQCKHVCPPQSQPPQTTAATTPEYVGASGGRLIATANSGTVAVSAPPPSIARCGSDCDDVQCAIETSTLPACCAAAARSRAVVTHQQTQQNVVANFNNSVVPTSIHNTNSWRATGHHPSPTAPPQTTTTTATTSNSQSQVDSPNPSQVALQSHQSSSSSPPSSSSPSPSSPALNTSASSIHQQTTTSSQTQQQSNISIQRAASLPVSSNPPNIRPHPVRSSAQQRRPEYSQSERITNRERPRFARSTSKTEAVKNFIRKETAVFFGVDQDTENEQQLKWLDRRKRLASRQYGDLKEEYAAPNGRTARPKTFAGYTASGAVPREPREDRPDVLPSNVADITDGIEERRYPVERPVRRKDSVARLTWSGLSYVVTTLTRHRPRPRSTTRTWSRSYPPEVAGLTSTGSTLDDLGLEDEVFFEKPTTSALSASSMGPPPTASPQPPDSPDSPPQNIFTYPHGDVASHSPHTSLRHHGVPYHGRPARISEQGAWRRSPERAATHLQPADLPRPMVGNSRIAASLLDGALDNSDRRQYGMGWIGRMFGRSMRHSVARDERVKKQLDDLEDHRPLFTWWVTTVQVLILAISLACYGLGPVGIDLAHRSGQVLVTSLSLQQVDYQEPANFWIGPRAGDLIHLGAKFAPCMRRDAKIIKEIEKGREKERETACCIRNDDSGCVQSSKADCSQIISTWKKWSAGDSGPGGRISGSVCGLDPKYCDAPASVAPYEWPDDITKWPICRKTNGQLMGGQAREGHSDTGHNFAGRPKDKMAEHMVCEVIGHPCCIGIHGQCRITTREYCDFVRGYFHEEASLCSQVSCMDDVCGMIPFYWPEAPDQVYRLWTSIFLHAGVLQLIVTLLVHYFLMRDLEKLTGSLRIAVIYLGSGVAGNLASAIFVPYRAEVGPAGAQFGLLACLIVEVLNARPMLRHPDRALIKLLSITLLLFLFGLLPWVDNYAHLFGFAFGFLLSYALMPFVSFGPYDREKKIALIWVCLLSAGFLFICLIILFYVIPVYDCEICTYFNCLPLTRNFCASQNINFKREEPVV